jgi:hypothetical protein
LPRSSGALRTGTALRTRVILSRHSGYSIIIFVKRYVMKNFTSGITMKNGSKIAGNKKSRALSPAF